MIFVCNNCGFLFERALEASQCPDCGNEYVEAAKLEERIRYLKIKTEGQA